MVRLFITRLVPLDGPGVGMRQIKHALSGAVYEHDGAGHILVTSRDGRTGVFDGEGTWLKGELRACDPHLCVWLAADNPELVSRHAAALGDREVSA